MDRWMDGQRRLQYPLRFKKVHGDKKYIKSEGFDLPQATCICLLSSQDFVEFSGIQIWFYHSIMCFKVFNNE